MDSWNKAVLSAYYYFYGVEVLEVSEIPLERLNLLLLYDCCELYRPLIKELLEKGMSTNAIARKTGLNVGEVRGIGRKLTLRK